MSVGIPYVGPVTKLPPKYAFRKFKPWGDEIGPIYQHKLFGEDHVWITDEVIANELLLKRASKYSSKSVSKTPWFLS